MQKHEYWVDGVYHPLTRGEALTMLAQARHAAVKYRDSVTDALAGGAARVLHMSEDEYAELSGQYIHGHDGATQFLRPDFDPSSDFDEDEVLRPSTQVAQLPSIQLHPTAEEQDHEEKRDLDGELTAANAERARRAE